MFFRIYLFVCLVAFQIFVLLAQKVLLKRTCALQFCCVLSFLFSIKTNTNGLNSWICHNWAATCWWKLKEFVLVFLLTKGASSYLVLCSKLGFLFVFILGSLLWNMLFLWHPDVHTSIVAPGSDWFPLLWYSLISLLTMSYCIEIFTARTSSEKIESLSSFWQLIIALIMKKIWSRSVVRETCKESCNKLYISYMWLCFTDRAQVVGWPPIRSFRKNTMSSHSSKNDDEAKLGLGCLYVKVSMDGAPYLRKVDLKTYISYMELSSALEKMFSCFTIGKTSLKPSWRFSLFPGHWHTPMHTFTYLIQVPLLIALL